MSELDMRPRFVAVYEVPEKITDGFCFGGGRPITFKNVDWFEAPPHLLTEFGLRDHIVRKNYYDPARRYLVLPRDTILFRGTSIAIVIEPEAAR